MASYSTKCTKVDILNITHKINPVFLPLSQKKKKKKKKKPLSLQVGNQLINLLLMPNGLIIISQLIKAHNMKHETLT